MDRFTHFTEGAASAVHYIATTAAAVNEVATVLGVIAGVIAPPYLRQGGILTIQDGPVLEVLSANFEAVSAGLEAMANAALADGQFPGPPVLHPVCTTGIAKNRRLLTIPIQKADIQKGTEKSSRECRVCLLCTKT